MSPAAEAKEWLKKADEDLTFASSVLPETTFYPQVCFHFQQAAEKYLKAYIVANDLEFRKVHDLRKLLKICEGKDNSFSLLRDEADYLSPFYVDTRYPVHWPATVGREEAFQAEAAARKIKNFVEKLL